MTGRLMVNLQGGDQVSYAAFACIAGSLEVLVERRPDVVLELFKKCFYQKDGYELLPWEEGTVSILLKHYLVDRSGGISKDVEKVVLSSIEKVNFFDGNSKLKVVNSVTSTFIA